MAITSLKGNRREGVGKSLSRKLRAQGIVPAVYYGRGEDPIALTVNAKEIDTLLHAGGSSNVIVDLQVEGDATTDRKALIREIQRDPVAGYLLHLDFQHISLTERITVEVPIELVGVPTGVKDGGGILEHLLREVEVECLPTDIPAEITFDVSGLAIGDSLHVSDLSAPGVEILTDGERTIATVVPPTVLEEAKPAEAEAGAVEPELVKEKKEDEGAAEGGKEG